MAFLNGGLLPELHRPLLMQKLLSNAYIGALSRLPACIGLGHCAASVLCETMCPTMEFAGLPVHERECHGAGNRATVHCM